MRKSYTSDMRKVVDGIFYLLKNGCQWRVLPGDFAPDWHTVYAYFIRWSLDGHSRTDLRRSPSALARESRRKGHPSAAILDSQSIRAAEAGGERGFDGAKGLVGQKRHLMVDMEGLPVDVVLTPANVGDRERGKRLLEQGKADLSRLSHLWVDGGYGGEPFAEWAEEMGGWTVEVVKKAEDRSFQVLPRRWVVERTFAWLLKCRRLCCDFEHRIESVVGCIYAAMLRLLVRRLAPSTPTS
jgi:putative transposase